MTTSHHEQIKAMKRPDRFLSTVSDVLGSLPNQGRWAVGVAIVVLVVGAGAALWSDRRAAQNESAQAAFYEAQKNLEKEYKALIDAVPDAPKSGKAKAPSDAESLAQASKEEKVRFQKLEVSKSFPSALGAFAAVSEKFPGTRAAQDALLAVGDLHLRHGSASEAAQWFERAFSQSSDRLSKALILMSLANAQENAGQCETALKTLDRALAQGEAVIRADAMLGLGRCQEILGKADLARAQYDKVISEFANSEAARTAEFYRLQLGTANASQR